MTRRRWKRSLLRLAAVALVAGGLPQTATGQVIHGHVLDADTREPVDAADVVMLAEDSVTADAATTDSAGYFSVSAAEAGQYRLLARRIGYPATISGRLGLNSGDTLRVEFRVSAGAVLLEPVEVMGRRRPPPPDIVDFYDRAERAIFGTFITREEIEGSGVLRASDLLRRVPGVQVAPARYGSSAVTIRGCNPLLIVDGVLARYERSIDNLVAPLELEGLEIYRSPTHVPVQYGGLRGTCGAVLIWTRRGP